MGVAYELARESLPSYSHKFSRHDFTLPQLFACLVVKEHQRRSYRGAEELLRDSPGWRRRAGMHKRRSPDHNTLWRAAKFLLRKCRVDKLLDAVARWAALRRALGLSVKPLSIDSTYFESRHVSRHYERRRNETAKGAAKGAAKQRDEEAKKARKAAGTGGAAKAVAKTAAKRRRTVSRLPKLAIAVAAHSHLILAVWTGTGAGSDHPHFQPVLSEARRRVPNARFAAALDAGYDSEANHELARGMGVRPLIPAEAGRPTKDGRPPAGRNRRRMKKLLGTPEGRKRSGYTQRWQVETANSMIKRNLGSALSGKTAWSRKRDMALKALTHDVMILANLDS
jgi:hypothetical protein